MKFTIAVCCSPQSPASRRALRFIEAALSCGYSIERLFFYQDGIYHALNSMVYPQDELCIPQQWQDLIVTHKIDAIVCVAAALRRGALDKDEAKRYNKESITVSPPWQISGLGQLHEAMQTSDHFISFAGEA